MTYEEWAAITAETHRPITEPQPAPDGISWRWYSVELAPDYLLVKFRKRLPDGRVWAGSQYVSAEMASLPVFRRLLAESVDHKIAASEQDAA
jgi:hypothetical protein